MVSQNGPVDNQRGNMHSKCASREVLSRSCSSHDVVVELTQGDRQAAQPHRRICWPTTLMPALFTSQESVPTDQVRIHTFYTTCHLQAQNLHKVHPSLSTYPTSNQSIGFLVCISSWRSASRSERTVRRDQLRQWHSLQLI